MNIIFMYMMFITNTMKCTEMHNTKSCNSTKREYNGLNKVIGTWGRGET